ncbi:MAG: winged helix-turn-helix transcriptional regulator [Clostridia bacterium]|nr:winged helix-turn-helix transcriptional regulator [Clostridia bacterium]
MSDEKRKQTETEYPQLQLSSQLCFPLYACARKVISEYTPLLKPFGLTYTQYIVLLALWEEEGKEKVGDVCHKLYLDCGTMTPMLKKMEENGWITRRRCKADERCVYVELTEKGWALRDEVKDIPAKLGKCISLPPEEAYELYRLLHKLLESV